MISYSRTQRCVMYARELRRTYTRLVDDARKRGIYVLRGEDRMRLYFAFVLPALLDGRFARAYQ